MKIMATYNVSKFPQINGGVGFFGIFAMKALIQRVTSASVNVNHQSIATIQQGLLVLLGVEQGDSIKIAEAMVKKIVSLRIFNNSQGKFDLSLNDVTGDLLMVSQFTLMADCKKRRTPQFYCSSPTNCPAFI